MAKKQDPKLPVDAGPDPDPSHEKDSEVIQEMTEDQFEAEIEKRVAERVPKVLAEQSIDVKFDKLADIVGQLAQTMASKADMMKEEREELLFRASSKPYIEGPNDQGPQNVDILKDARDAAERNGYMLGPWSPVEQINASPLVEKYPFWYIAYCQQTGADCQVRWNPPPETTGGEGQWYPSRFGRAVQTVRYAAVRMIDKWAQQVGGMPGQFVAGKSMKRGGFGSPTSLEVPDHQQG